MMGSRMRFRALSLVAGVVLSAGLSARASAWRFYPSEDTTPGLPRVLLVGDSICNGYRGTVTSKLKGKALVDVWLTPLHIAHKGLAPGMLKVMGEHDYDIVTFNHGLHGFGERIPKGKYAELLEAYVLEVKKAAGKGALVWVNTTPVNAKGDNAVLDPVMNPMVVKRNAQAAEIMKRQGISVVDLYSLVVGKPELRARAEDQYHYSAPGKKLQGELLANEISAILAARGAGKVKTDGPVE